MKKLIFLLVVFIFLFVSGRTVFAVKPNTLSDVVYELQAKVEDLIVRVTTLENSQKENYYTRNFGPYNITKGVAVSTIYGCYDGDIAISGGLYGYSGTLSNWRTIRSYPLDSQYNNHVWETTVINEVENGTFSLTVKCLDRS